MKGNVDAWSIIHFDGAVSAKGAGVGIWISTPKGRRYFSSLWPYKLYFECTNNVAEYEALILGLNILKKFKARNVYIYGDSKLVINKVNEVYMTKHPRLRSYRNLVLDFLENFNEDQLIVLPRDQNAIADALAISASNFEIPIHPNKKYEIKVKHRPSVPDNVKY